MDNVVLICNEKSILETLKANLTLLRKFDSISCCDFLDADKTIKKNSPQIIILYSNIIDDKIKELTKTINNIPIIYISDELSDENLLALYEMGITDFLTTESSQTEFLIKVMSCLKKNTEKIKAARNTEILEQIGIIKKGTNFYSVKYTPAVLKKFIQKYMKNTKITLMAVAPDINIKNKNSLDYLAALLKQNLREEDIIGFQSDKLYILLPNTTKQGALDVYNKIKSTLNNDYTICAGILEIENPISDYKLISQKVNEALSDALLIKNSVVVQENLNIGMAMNWLDKSNKKSKNFKLFKKALMKKIENAITPVFYQKQQMVEQRLFEVEVEQFSNEKESRFTLKNDKKYSIFEITYPGAVKLDFYIYKNVYKNSEPEYQSYELPKVNDKLISDLLDKFIKEFDK